jgi:predicted Rossmann fold flavoprotein
MMKNYDAIIIGAGAAGLMCALRAGQRGRRVLLLDHADKVGAKILVSGGGRCNFTNLQINKDRFLSNNPHFCISALKGYGQQDFITLVKKHKIAYHEKTLGQLFCDNSAHDIVNMLLEECHNAQVEIKLRQQVRSATKSDVFSLQTQEGKMQATSLVLATGGLSIPKMGATEFAYKIAEHFKIPIIKPRPALVPLVFDGEDFAFLRALSGITLEVIAACGRQSFREGLVVTHRGLSGPAILQISSYWREGMPISLDLLPHLNAEDLLLERKKARPKAELKTILGEMLPQRLAETIASTYFVNEMIGAITDKKLKDIATFLKNWQLTPTGTAGYEKAEVTAGGIDTTALSSKTMEVNAIPGLYIIGEAVDVTGWLGGYNFQWAWSSGWAAGSAL